MTRRVIWVLLGVGLLVGLVAIAGDGAFRLPGDDTGYEPLQPIQYSHRLHAGELKIECLYCHNAAERGRHAGIPAASVCMNCHELIRAPWQAVRQEAARAKAEKREVKPITSSELKKLVDAVEGNRPIEWTRVYRLPDYVYFDHRPHVVSAGLACQACHGPVETMARVRQVRALTMGWCLDCHRGGETARVAGLADKKGPTDCVACHY